MNHIGNAAQNENVSNWLYRGMTSSHMELIRERAQIYQDLMKQKIRGFFLFKSHINCSEFIESFKALFSLNAEEYQSLLENIFTLADSNHDFMIDMNEYLDLISLFAAQSPDEKITYILKLCHSRSDGSSEMKYILNNLRNNEVCRHLFDFAVEEKIESLNKATQPRMEDIYPIPFEYFWDNYGTFQMKPQFDYSADNHSFENLTAIRESSRQTIEIQNLIEEVNSSSNFPRICSCPTISIASLNPHPSSVTVNPVLTNPSPMPMNPVNHVSYIPQQNPYLNVPQYYNQPQVIPQVIPKATHKRRSSYHNLLPLVAKFSQNMIRKNAEAQKQKNAQTEEKQSPSSTTNSPVHSPPGSFDQYPAISTSTSTSPKEKRANSAPDLLTSNSHKRSREEDLHETSQNEEDSHAKSPSVKPHYVKQRRKSYEKIMGTAGFDSNNNKSSNANTQDSFLANHSIADHLDLTGSVSKHKRFEWSNDLHQHFIAAYEKLSLKCYPTPKLLMIEMISNGAGPLMTGLTRIHVNTHLQKYEQGIAQAPKRQSKFFAFRNKNAAYPHLLPPLPSENILTQRVAEMEPTERFNSPGKELINSVPLSLSSR